MLGYVSGKSMGAALLMSSTRSVLRLHVANGAVTVQSLLKDVDQFASGYPASDDITVVKITRQR